MERKYWALGFNSNYNRLEKFITENFWDAMDFSSSDNSKAANNARDKFNNITVGDIVAIKGYGGSHDINIHYIGEVIDIDNKDFKLYFKKVKTQLFQGKAPRGNGAGNWRDTVVQIKRHDIIELIFPFVSGVDNLAEMKKEKFKTWLAKNTTNNNSGKNDSYLRALDILENELSVKVYIEDDIYKLEKLYQDLIKNQADKEGKYFYEKAPSYGNNGFFSASVKIFIQFLNENESKDITKAPIKPVSFEISIFQKNCASAGLIYSNPLITRYFSSLATKPFVLLTGLSGSGKTKLAQAFAQWICESKEQYCLVPVGADWTNREPLLGYVNALKNTEYILPENGALELIIKANEDPTKPYFLILDEMNLSHVERYFADFLSVMESKDKFKLHSSNAPLQAENGRKVESEYGWPSNLFVVGTVNIDETTYMFSPKVLDRANVIEFRIDKGDLSTYFGADTQPLNMENLCLKESETGLGAQFGESFVIKANKPTKKEGLETINKELLTFFEKLQEIGAEFGYRTASEIQTLFDKIEVIHPELKDEEDFKKLNIGIDSFKIDVAIMQKLLPKLHGSRNKLADVLKTLAGFCVKNYKESKEDNKNIFEKKELEIIYPISFEKLKRMHKNVIENGFTSYAEA